jgi:hypothetical protein
MEPTEFISEEDGVQTRIWNGVTENDEQVFVFVRYVASRGDMQGLIELAPKEKM